ncbi:bifunctional lysylphosphatidylglycerol flippase/synthetase MprF [Paenibacillus pabuli]|uniref:bifunctional lysylphosphatidylglycerol flippase/synthetase MprF n=1 Tax=Paenibacillus pabuli TaxID=1472 RepID=UPI0032B3443A
MKIFIPLVILSIIYRFGRNEIQHIDMSIVMYQLNMMSVSDLTLLCFASFFAVAVMSSYDYLIRKQFKLDIHWMTTFRYAWIANTFNNMIGFAGLTAAGLRTYLYKNSGVSINKMGPAVIFLSPIIFVGLAFFGWFVLAGLFPAEAIFNEHAWLRFGVIGVSLYFPLFLFIQRSSIFAKWFNKGERKIEWKVVMFSLCTSIVEWACAGILFGLITSFHSEHLPFASVFGVYIVAAIAGTISMAPGGIGAFDVIAVLGLQSLGVQSTNAVVILLMFRIFYFILPWLLGILLALFEVILHNAKFKSVTSRGITTVRNKWGGFWGWPTRFDALSGVGAWLLEKLVLISGIILLISAARPGLSYRLRFMEHFLSLPIMHVSELLSVSVGILLIIVSRGILKRTQRAYQWTVVLLLAGAVFTFLKGFDYEEALFLLFVTILLWISRSQFNRQSAKISRISFWTWSSLMIFLTVVFCMIGSQKTHLHPILLNKLPNPLQQWLLSPHEYTITIFVESIGVLVLLASIFALRPYRPAHVHSGESSLEKLTEFVTREKGNSLTHLLYLGDKQFYWAKDHQVLIPYSRVRHKLVVLGDPLGNINLIGQAIQEFQHYAKCFSLSVVFYQVTPEYLPIYHENGYKFLKLGEEALVPLETFSMSGKKNQNFRTALNKSKREGQTFEVLTPPYHPDLLSELRLISDEWLGDRKEKTYSLGWFDEAHLQRFPIALLRDAEGKILAFATLAPDYDHNRVISIDLMRHLNETPNGTMDVLFVSLMEWAKEQGFSYFNLGMSPLSRVGENPNAHREEKFARLVFQYGGYWYGFEGLRRYKEKFSPEWQARYLAYPSGVALPILTAELIKLISRQPKM